MPRQKAGASKKQRVGTMRCPLTGTMSDVFEARRGPYGEGLLYYRNPVSGCIQPGRGGQSYFEREEAAGNLKFEGDYCPPWKRGGGQVPKGSEEPAQEPAAVQVQEPVAEPAEEPRQAPRPARSTFDHFMDELAVRS